MSMYEKPVISVDAGRQRECMLQAGLLMDVIRQLHISIRHRKLEEEITEYR